MTGIDKYAKGAKEYITIEQLQGGATLAEISNKIKEIKEFNIHIKEELSNQLITKGIEVESVDTIQDLIEKISLI